LTRKMTDIMKHLKLFLESASQPVRMYHDQMQEMMRGQVIDEITPGEIDKITRVITDSGLSGKITQYKYTNSGKTRTMVGIGDRVETIFFGPVIGTQRPAFIDIHKTTDDWWWVETVMRTSVDVCYLCDGLAQVVDLIRDLAKKHLDNQGG
jgi:hypothetical protein